MNPDLIAECDRIAALAEKATAITEPMTWVVDDKDILMDAGIRIDYDDVDPEEAEATANFICAAVNDAPALIAKLKAELLARNNCGEKPVGPDRCPFTGRPFWGNIEHPELGLVATYGGPFDTYTIPQRDDADPSYYFYRFDHDEGGWVDSAEDIGKQIVSDQLYTSEDDPEELKKQLAEANARAESNAKDAIKYQTLSTPEIHDFILAVEREALHQRDRWGADHDAGKADSDWFWLVGYLAGKALSKPEKALHHIITTAAACLNWHAAKLGTHNKMRPGIDPPVAMTTKRKRLTPKQRVLKRWPMAICLIYPEGKCEVFRRPPKCFRARPLSCRNSPRQAWADAAKRLERRMK